MERKVIKLRNQLQSYKAVCELFELTPEEMNAQYAGDWMVDLIKQFQTASILYRSTMLKGRISDYRAKMTDIDIKNAIDSQSSE